MKQVLNEFFKTILAIIVVGLAVAFGWTWLVELYIVWAIVVAYAQQEQLRKNFLKTLPSNITITAPLKKKIYKPFNVILAFGFLIALILMLIIDNSSLTFIYIIVTIIFSEQMSEVIKWLHQFIHPRFIYLNNSSVYFYEEKRQVIQLPQITRIELYEYKAEIFQNKKKTVINFDRKIEEQTY